MSHTVVVIYVTTSDQIAAAAAHRLSAALSVTDTAPRRASSTNRDHVADTLTNVAVTIASQRPASADRLAGDVSYASIVLCRLRKTSSFRRHYGEKPKI